MTATSRGMIFLICTVAVFAAYGNALFNEFVYDDSYLIIKNDFIKDFRHIPEICVSDVTVTTPYRRPSGYYRPVSMIFLMFAYKLWGLNPAGFHLISVLLHLANVLLVFLIFQEICRNRFSGLIAAFFFAVHPIHVEAVTPVYNYMGLLAAFFAMASFWVFLKSEGMGRKIYLIWSFVFYAASIFSKENALILPAIFFVYDYLFWARFRLKEILRRLKAYAVYGCLALVYLLARISFVDQPAALGFWNLDLFFNIGQTQGLISHLLTVIEIYFFYIMLLFFPFHLNAFHWIPASHSLLSAPALSALICIGGLIIYALVRFKTYPRISFLIFFFFLSSLMVSNLIPIGGIFAERFMYLPSVAFCGLIGLVAGRIIRSDQNFIRAKTKMTVLLLVLVGGIYLMQTVTRNYIWRTDISLWKDTLKKTPNAFTPHLNLAEAYDQAGEIQLALKHYEIASRFSGWKQAFIHNKMGKIYAGQGLYHQALEHFKKAFELNQREEEFFYNAGMAYFYLDDFKKAQDLFEESLKRNQDYAWSYYGFGLVYEKKGQRQKARQMFKQAYRLNPQFDKAAQALRRMEPQ